MTDIDRSPTRVASAVAILGAVLTVGVTGLYSWFTLGFGVAGVALLAVGLGIGRQALVTLGGACLFAGVLVAGIDGAPPAALLLGAVATVLAWDSASTALGLGAQLGRETATRRIELAHATATALVGGAGAVVAFGIYSLVTGEASPTAIFLFVLAVVLIASALR